MRQYQWRQPLAVSLVAVATCHVSSPDESVNENDVFACTPRKKMAPSWNKFGNSPWIEKKFEKGHQIGQFAKQILEHAYNSKEVCNQWCISAEWVIESVWIQNSRLVLRETCISIRWWCVLIFVYSRYLHDGSCENDRTWCRIIVRVLLIQWHSLKNLKIFIILIKV